MTGGLSNTASQRYASVAGGYHNTADGWYSSVTGGSDNTGSANYSSVTGGMRNLAGGDGNSVVRADDVTCDPAVVVACGEGSISGGDTQPTVIERPQVRAIPMMQQRVREVQLVLVGVASYVRRRQHARTDDRSDRGSEDHEGLFRRSASILPG